MSNQANDGDVTAETGELSNNDIGELDQSDPVQTEPSQTGGESGQNSIGILEVQQRARDAATDLLEHEFEGVIKVETTADNWRTVIEVVERSAVPDTQDILGRYEITLDMTGSVIGYELIERYRRGEMKEEL